MDELNPVAGAVSSHYSAGDLAARIDAALDAAGVPREASWSDLAAIDQFHARGLAATKELATALSLSPGDSVLDVGCGIGGPSRYLAAVSGCAVTGIDLCEPYVEAARSLARRTGLADKVSYLHADALELPFGDGSFDHAWTQHVAMNIKDKRRLYVNVHRVLRPHGRFAIYDVVAGNGDPLVFPVPWARTPDISFLVTPDEMRNVLASVGFKELSAVDSTEAGVAWFEKQRIARESASAPNPLGLHLIMGPEFATMTGNLIENLRSGRARLVQTVVERM